MTGPVMAPEGHYLFILVENLFGQLRAAWAELSPERLLRQQQHASLERARGLLATWDQETRRSWPKQEKARAIKRECLRQMRAVL